MQDKSVGASKTQCTAIDVAASAGEEQLSGIGTLPAPYRSQADSDATLIRLWLDGRSPHTQRAYLADVGALLRDVDKPIAAITLGELQHWLASLVALAPASRARKIGAVKSLLGFGQRIGYLPFNVGAALRTPPVRGVLAERILEEGDVIRLIALERDPRNHALL